MKTLCKCGDGPTPDDFVCATCRMTDNMQANADGLKRGLVAGLKKAYVTASFQSGYNTAMNAIAREIKELDPSWDGEIK